MKTPKQKILDPIDNTKHALDSEEAGEVRADSYDEKQFPSEIADLMSQRVADDEGSEDFNGNGMATEEVISLDAMADEEKLDIINTGDDTNE